MTIATPPPPSRYQVVAQEGPFSAKATAAVGAQVAVRQNCFLHCFICSATSASVGAQVVRVCVKAQVTSCWERKLLGAQVVGSASCATHTHTHTGLLTLGIVCVCVKGAHVVPPTKLSAIPVVDLESMRRYATVYTFVHAYICVSNVTNIIN